jgi:hypothetical protein
MLSLTSDLCAVLSCNPAAADFPQDALEELETYDGFAGIRIIRESNTVQIAWVGTPPKSAIALATAHDEKYTVSFISATYSLTQLQAAMDLLSMEPNELVAGTSLTTMGPDPDGRNLVVGFDGDPELATALMAALEKLTGIDVVVEFTGPLIAQ